MLLTDCDEMFRMDTDPQVRAFLFGSLPPSTVEESKQYIEKLHKQYIENGIGRWTVIEIITGRIIGWAGLKIEINVNNHDSFYDLGYRFWICN